MTHALVCFDWDGTLSESRHHIVQCVKHTLADMQQAVPSDEAIMHLIGKSEEEISHIYFKEQKEQAALFWHTFRQRYRACPPPPLMPGARECLERHQHFSLCIVSNKTLKDLEKEIEYHQIGYFFDYIYSADVYEAKPSPAMIQQALKDSGIAREHSWMIGDHLADAQAARAAGVHFIPVHAHSWHDSSQHLHHIHIG